MGEYLLKMYFTSCYAYIEQRDSSKQEAELQVEFDSKENVSEMQRNSVFWLVQYLRMGQALFEGFEKTF